MSIVYPIYMPTYPAPAHVTLTQQNSVALSASPFTAAQQAQEWPGDWWEMEMSLPPMAASDAGMWRAFLGALRGQSGTFAAGPGGLISPSGGYGGYNLLLWTNDLSNTVWVRTTTGGLTTPTINANSITSPEGTTTASDIFFPATSSVQQVDITQVAAYCITANQTFTLSVYLKAFVAAPYVIAFSNPDNSETFQQTVFVTTAWKRFTVSGQYSQYSPFGGQMVYIRQPPSSLNAQLYVWSAQLERNSDATTPQYMGEGPTVSAGVAGGKTVTLRSVSVPVGSTSFAAGDYIQIASHLYMSLTSPRATDLSATVTLDVFPRLRTDVGGRVTWIDPQGVWRLQENARSFGQNVGNIFDFSLKAREAL